MIPPLTDDEYDRLIPQWAKDADAKKPRDKLAVGMRVYNVLYGPREGNPFGTVTDVDENACGSMGDGVRVVTDDAAVHIAAAAYYVPVPQNHDPKEGNRNDR